MKLFIRVLFDRDFEKCHDTLHLYFMIQKLTLLQGTCLIFLELFPMNWQTWPETEPCEMILVKGKHDIHGLIRAAFECL